MRETVQRLRDAVARFFQPVQVGFGAISDEKGAHVRSTYPDEYSMAALARFPWVRAAVEAKVTDLSSVPIVAIRTAPDGTRERIPNHPLVALLNKPGGRRGGLSLRRQLYTDHTLTGDCYAWRVGSALFRLHPRKVTVIADETLGVVKGYELQRANGSVMSLPMEDVVHVSTISWEDGPKAAVGAGAIVALHHDLVANIAVKEMTAKAAKRGRLELLLSPKGEEVAFSKEQVTELVDSYERNRQMGRAAFVVGRDVSAQPLGLSPRDMEFGEQDLRTQAAILAVISVPPVRVSLPGANYGTTKQQMRTYWESLRGVAVIFDEALSLLESDPSITLEHDFTQVEALQVSYTERQARARGWWEMGATAKDAAAYEGFIDAPLGDTLFADAGQTPFRRPAQQPDQSQEGRAAVIGRYLEGARDRYSARIAAASGEWTSAVDEESLRLLLELERLGVQADDATTFAHQAAAQLDETARRYRAMGRPLTESGAFDAARAHTLLLRIPA